IEYYFMKFVLLITAPIESSNAWHAYYFAKTALEQGHQVSPFFYNDGVTVATRLILNHDNANSLNQCWQNLAKQHQLELAVCVAAALRRGITDADNSHRHHLQGDNLADGFTLTGLGTLTDLMINSDRFLQF
ncbi:MAG TPA: sulfurtransferase complex subunit TusD, partial [Agitococcus sp.]|nr:sulfurtransferase complex subunit TusD [Agitococcus sp.]HNC01991.1 sulfurtransferase complex subunit TusD [Agitococcus sp.]